MKRVIVFTCICITISCNTGDHQSEPDLVFSSHYKPPVTDIVDLTDRILDIAPDLHQSIENHSEKHKIPGISYGVVVDDSLVISSSTGIINIEQNTLSDTNSAFRIASMSKSFTAMAIIKLRDDGKLSLEDPISKYIPEAAGLIYLTSDAPEINIRNLLTMTAGLPEDNPWGDRQLDESDEMLIGMVKEGISFSNVPSTEYEYSNTGFALLGNIISRISGMPYQQYIKEQIFSPLGMDHTYWEYSEIPEDKLVDGYRWEDEQWKREPILHDGSFGAIGGVITTIEDFSKYVQFHLSAWPPRNEEETGPIKRSSLREMHTPNFSRHFVNNRDRDDNPCPIMYGYGYGLGIATDCHSVVEVGHSGALPGYGSNYVFYPDYGVGLMAFGNLTYTTPWPLQHIKKLLFDEAGIQPRKLPVSEILIKRQEEIITLIQDWESGPENILAENFYLDIDKEHRIAQIQEILANAGNIQEIGEITPLNQLRGSFTLQAENGTIDIFFTLTPENDPKVQRLDLRFKDR